MNQMRWWRHRTYTSKDMTTEEAMLCFVGIPPSLLIIQKGWPFFCHELEVGIVLVKHGNCPGRGVSNGARRLGNSYPAGSASNASRCLRGMRNLAIALCSIPIDSLGRASGIAIPRSWPSDGCRYWRIESRTALVPFTRACVAALEIWMAGAQDVDAGVGWGRAYLGKESQVLPCLEMCCQILGTPQE